MSRWVLATNVAVYLRWNVDQDLAMTGDYSTVVTFNDQGKQMVKINTFSTLPAPSRVGLFLL